jgi:hypothetical protein
VRCEAADEIASVLVIFKGLEFRVRGLGILALALQQSELKREHHNHC